MRKILLLITLALLVGCAQTISATQDEISVEIHWVGDLQRAGSIASDHCSTFGKIAQFKYTSPGAATFDCVMKSQ